jgi:hypothetical protein
MQWTVGYADVRSSPKICIERSALMEKFRLKCCNFAPMRGPLKRCRRPPFVCQPPIMLLGKFLINSFCTLFRPRIVLVYCLITCSSLWIDTFIVSEKRENLETAWRGKPENIFHNNTTLLYAAFPKSGEHLGIEGGPSLDHCHGSGTSNAFRFWPCCRALLNSENGEKREVRERGILSRAARSKHFHFILLHTAVPAVQKDYSYKIASSCYRHYYIGAAICRLYIANMQLSIAFVSNFPSIFDLLHKTHTGLFKCM